MSKFDDITTQIATRASAGNFSALGMALPNPDAVLRAAGKNITVYENMLGDARVGAAVRRRKAAVTAMTIEIDAGDCSKTIFKEVKSMLADLPMDAFADDCMNAVLFGYQPMEINWTLISKRVVPSEVIAKPPEWFFFDRENNMRFRQHGKTDGIMLPDRKFLLPRQSATYKNPYGFADLSMCFWPLTFLKSGLKFWLVFSEKYGTPFLLGKVPAHTQEKERNAMRDELEAMVQDAVGVIDADADIEIKEAGNKSGSVDVYTRLIEFCAGSINIALTGTNQTTEADANKASAVAGNEVSKQLRNADAKIVQSAINQLVRWYIELNYGNQARPNIKLVDAADKAQSRTQRDKDNVGAGAKLTRQYFIRQYGYQEDELAPDVQNKPLMHANHAQHKSMVEVGELDKSFESIIEAMQGMVDAAQSLEELQAMISAAYDQLPVSDFQSVMGLGLQMATLAGISNVMDE